MSHEVETMAYVGEQPWHGLGVELNEGVSPEEMLVASGLDWEIKKSRMWTMQPNNPTKPVVIDDYFALVRDTDASVLGVCGKNYIPFQNAEVFKFFKRYCDAGRLQMNTAGSLQGGRYIWALAKVNSFNITDEDRTDGYLLLTQPHIWGKAMTVLYTAVRVVCWNTMTMALNTAGEKFHVPHIRAFDQELIEAVAEAVGLADSCMAEHRDKVSFLAKTRAERTDQMKYVAELLQPEMLDVFGTAKETKDIVSLAGAGFKRMATAVSEAIITSPGAKIKVGKNKVSDTWYGALNGVTYIVDHVKGRNRDLALQSAWFGKDAGLKRRALDLAVKYAKAA